MPVNTILLVENNKGTVASQLSGLEGLTEKFKFVATDSSAVVESVFKVVNVGVFDIRLKDDTDEHDYSGLELARRVAEEIPTIIFSLPQNYETARKALNWPPKDNHPNVFFVPKNGTGVTKLVEMLEKQVLPKATASGDRIRIPTRLADKSFDRVSSPTQTTETRIASKAGRSRVDTNKTSDGPSQLRLMLPVLFLGLTLITAAAALLFGWWFLLIITFGLAITAAALMITTLKTDAS